MGRLSGKGAWLYKFLRIPNEHEFELRGATIWTEQCWQSEVAPQRAADLTAEEAYHKNTRVPSFEEVQLGNARSSMALTGGNLPVKLYPLDWKPIDDTAAGYRRGSGIFSFG
jgi:hypothetical protein